MKPLEAVQARVKPSWEYKPDPRTNRHLETQFLGDAVEAINGHSNASDPHNHDITPRTMVKYIHYGEI